MPERLTTTGRTYQDPPKLQGTPYVVSNDPLNPNNPFSYPNQTPPSVTVPQPTYEVQNSEFGQPDSNTIQPIQRGPQRGSATTQLIQPRQGAPDTANRSPRATEDQLKGTAFEGAAIVGSEDGLFSTGGADQGQVVIAGGVNGRAVSLSLGSVLPPGVLDTNAVFNIVARIRDERTAKETQDDKGNFDLQSQLAETKEGLIEGQTTLANLLAGTRDKRNTNIGQVEVNKYNEDVLVKSRKVFPRYLSKFSYIIFILSDNTKIMMPFFENPKIEERRLIQYNIADTAGNVTPIMTYKSTQQANIKITFNLNSMHIAEMLSEEKLFDINQFIFGTNYDDFDKAKNILYKFSEYFYFDKIQPELANANRFDPNNFLGRARPQSDDPFANNLFEVIKDTNTPYKFAQALCLLWIYTIKNLVFLIDFNTFMNTGSMTEGTGKAEATLGTAPKKMILNHGPVYFNIPCTLIDYSIKELTNTSYDVTTNMANIYEVTLNVYAEPAAFKNTEIKFGMESIEIPTAPMPETKDQSEQVAPPAVQQGNNIINNPNTGGLPGG